MGPSQRIVRSKDPRGSGARKRFQENRNVLVSDSNATHTISTRMHQLDVNPPKLTNEDKEHAIADRAYTNTRQASGKSTSQGTLIAADIIDSAACNRDVLTCSPFRNLIRHPSDYIQPTGDHMHDPPSSQARANVAMGLGATVPPELFEFILFYVGDDYRESSSSVIHPLGRSSSYRRHKDIAVCSLVCRHWANQCREYMFSGMTLLISSPVEAETFVEYATRGCLSLKPVHELISAIVVEQRYNASRSFCHRLHPVKAICNVLYELRLIGPIPPKFSPRALDTPHWSLPPSMIIPRSLLPYEKITLSNVHLPSFSHISKYVAHFGVAQEVYLEGVTWNMDDREPTTTNPRDLRFPGFRWDRLRFHRFHFSGRLQKTAWVDRQDNSIGSVYSGKACTDNFDVCLQIATTHPLCVVHILHDEEQQLIVTLLSWAHTSFVLAGSVSLSSSCTWRDEVRNPEALGSKIVVSFKDLNGKRNHDLTFSFNDRTSSGSLVFRARVVSLEASFSWERKNSEKTAPPEVEINTLIAYLDHFPTLSIVVFRFPTYDHLSEAMQYNGRAASFDAHIAGRKYVLVYHRDEEDDRFPDVPRAGKYSDFVGIDPVTSTLSPTGQSWEYYWQIIPSYIQSHR